MTATFDSYLLRRFAHALFIGFVASFGLFVVIDGFTNVDGFQAANKGDGASVVLLKMAAYYAYQSSVFFDLTGPFLTVFSAVVVFSMLQRHGEIHPMLSAGVPTYRLAVPIVVGTLFVNALFIINQELIIPQIAHHLQAPRGEDENDALPVEPGYDRGSKVHISGKGLYLNDRSMRGAALILPVPEVVHEMVTLHADEAVYQEATLRRSAGWLLRRATPQFEEIEELLSSEGRKIVLSEKAPTDIFVVSDVSFDQLFNRSTGYRYLSTWDLRKRIRAPSSTLASARNEMVHLHSRLTRPLMNVVAVLIAIPFVVRKESTGLVKNLATCAGAVLLVFGTSQLFLYLGEVNLLAPDLSAWSPVILCGTLSAWFASLVQT